MGSLRTVVSAVLAWLVVVAVGSTVVWLVISRAGDGVAPTVGADVPAASSSRSAGPSGSPSPRPPSPHPTHPSTPAPSTPQPDAAQRRTWQGAGGLVTVECRGTTIALVGSSADAGFVVDPGSRGPAEVDVTFEGQGEEGRETRVRAHCAQGVPVFEVDARDE